MRPSHAERLKETGELRRIWHAMDFSELERATARYVTVSAGQYERLRRRRPAGPLAPRLRRQLATVLLGKPERLRVVINEAAWSRI